MEQQLQRQVPLSRKFQKAYQVHWADRMQRLHSWSLQSPKGMFWERTQSFQMLECWQHRKWGRQMQVWVQLGFQMQGHQMLVQQLKKWLMAYPTGIVFGQGLLHFQKHPWMEHQKRALQAHQKRTWKQELG
jgi:hypothetical protein